MNIAVLGAGPAGLYAALLLKKADPNREITVWEQNPPDASYGWGVVFSDTTLAEFREADHRSYVDITDRFVRWEAIDIRYRGRLVRARGQPFAGIRRTALLGILQDRCRGLGVDLRFEERLEDVDALRAEHDLVVAADGVNSVARQALPEVFRAQVEEGRARYIWFGTPLPLDSFTFSFRRHDAGWFQAHAYPFDGEMSTFIPECHEDVWRRAGLDRASEGESIAFCEELFAEDLRGRPLRSNNSKWISFLTVRNRAWRQGNLVLLGDAAHTAHFSIGSGTKLAMEDAIALAAGFERHPADLEAALADYEAERRPRVERFQEAARQSQAYFERVDRYTRMEPEQFAFYLLTRSGRIGYSNLRMRDPSLVEEVDRWFDGGRRRLVPPPLFHPLRLREVTVPNRVVAEVPATDRAEDGTADPGLLQAVADAARSGAGLVLPPPVAVAAEGRITSGDPGLYREDHAEAWTEAIRQIHEGTDALVAVTLGHAGPRAATRPRTAGVDRPLGDPRWPLLAASAIAYLPEGPTPKAMSEAEMARTADRFAAAAELASAAGVDLLLLHLGQGYLLGSFLSPLTNHRDDGYGGGLEGRMRFPLQVWDAVRSAWPADRPLGAVITADDRRKGGAGLDEAVTVARALRERGCDLVRPVAGQTTWNGVPAYGPAFLAPYGDRIRNEAGVATLVRGAIATTDDVNTLVAGGRADVVVLDYAPRS
jgi:anthraniloyl-CoA monooxygenase